MERLIELNQLVVFEHTGFWRAMDTLRDQKQLEALWGDDNAPWKIWN